MQSFGIRLLFPGLAAMLMFACARQGMPAGGPKDVKPPVMDTLRSSPNFTIHFQERRIEMVFNEWLELKDAGQQVVISPPLAKKPEITLHGKKVVIDFGPDPKFRPNTTYTMNMGTSVRDLHESNPVAGLRYVFSTGDHIDSLRVAGTARDAFSGDVVKDLTVMLYDTAGFYDSLILKENPYYFARTDENGLFLFENLRSGVFYAIAVEEGSLPDLRWNGTTERIGTAGTTISITGDSAARKAPIQLVVSTNQPRQKLLSRNASAYGVIRLTYATRPDPTFVSRQDGINLTKFNIEQSQDSLVVWYDLPAEQPAMAWLLLSQQRDTIQVGALSRADFIAKHRLTLADDAGQGKRGGKNTRSAPVAGPTPVKTTTLPPNREAAIAFNVPLTAIDTAKWRVLEDSTTYRKFQVRIDSVQIRNAIFKPDWRPGHLYKLTLLPGAVTDMYGATNADTLQRAFQIPGEKELSNLNLTIDSLKAGRNYVLQILNGQIVEAERVFQASQDSTAFSFEQMFATSYVLRLIEDLNGNGRWDGIDYFNHRPPEVVFTKKLDALRANWTVEARMQATQSVEKRKKF